MILVSHKPRDQVLYRAAAVRHTKGVRRRLPDKLRFITQKWDQRCDYFSRGKAQNCMRGGGAHDSGRIIERDECHTRTFGASQVTQMYKSIASLLGVFGVEPRALKCYFTLQRR